MIASTTHPAQDAALRFRADYDRAAQDRLGGEPGWLTIRRKAAIARFDLIGLPGRRDEEWRFTDIRPIVDTPFVPAGLPTTLEVTPDTLAPHLIAGDDAHVLVFVNGRFNPELSRLRTIPSGVTVGSLHDALQHQPERLQTALTQSVGAEGAAFTLLNTALFEDGAFVHVSRNQVLATPILLLYVTTPGSEPTVSYPRSLIVLEAGSQATVIESYAGLGESETPTLTNAVTEIVVEENAVLDHVKINQEHRSAYHVATTDITLQRSANFLSNSVTLGGAIVRNDFNAGLRGEGIECTLNGVYLGRDRQLIDNHTAIDHALPHCNSHETYKGILDDRARGVFNGKIFVRQDAQKTDAKQTNQTLLLSDEAQINTKPQLEIFADDVRCTHGATIGQLNKEAIFYLRSRGIGAHEARAMLTYAFANDVVSRIKTAPVREELGRLLLEQLRS